MNRPLPSSPSQGVSLSAIADLLGDVRVQGDPGVRVTGAREDSRRVEPGDLFVARAGHRFDGVRFASDAVRRGAVALLAAESAVLPASLGVPVVRVPDPGRVASVVCEAIFGWPSRSLEVVGITGTNGKTTTAWLLAELLRAAGGRAARLGTLGFSFEGDASAETLTTPAPDETARFLARARDAGASHLVMEVSSHALAQARVDGLRFAAAALTNLTQDHLDYHETMEAYGRAKERLFFELSPGVSVINVDDPFGRELATRAPGSVVTVGRDRGAHVHPLEVRIDAAGLSGRIQLPSGVVAFESRLVGEHNLENILVALGVVDALRLDPERAATALSSALGAPGRLERCDGPDDDLVVLVDYAHTPGALARVLEAVRPLTSGDVCCVFGCGGDRDAKKRPLMGDAVGRAADRAFITNDNPRSEDPRAIAEAIEAGIRTHAIAYSVVLDRSEAILAAVLSANPGDVVLLAGKGHEPYQIVGDERRPFDDRVEARRALALRREKS